MAKEAKAVEAKKDYKVMIKFDGSTTATIIRPGMPFIVDGTSNIMKYASSFFKEEEIEVMGEKPASWAVFFPKPVIEAPVVELAAGVPAEVEQVSAEVNAVVDAIIDKVIAEDLARTEAVVDKAIAEDVAKADVVISEIAAQ